MSSMTACVSPLADPLIRLRVDVRIPPLPVRGKARTYRPVLRLAGELGEKGQQEALGLARARAGRHHDVTPLVDDRVEALPLVPVKLPAFRDEVFRQVLKVFITGRQSSADRRQV